MVACGGKTDDDETSGSDLAALAESNIEHALRGAHGAGSFLADSATVADSLGSLGGGSETCTYECTPDGLCQDVCTTVPVTVADLQQDRDDLSDGIDDVMKTLREEIFTSENLESEGGGTATYLLHPKTLCSSTTSSVDTPGTGAPAPAGTGGSGTTTAPPPEPELDPDCVDEINRIQPRLRLSSPSAGNVDVEILLTSSHLNPVTIELHQDHAAIVVDLAETKATLDAAGEDTSSIAQMAGKFGLGIYKNGNLDYSLRASIIDAITLGITNDAGEAINYALGASDRMLELRLDGNQKKVTGSLDYGTMTIAGPLNAFKDSFAPVEYDPVTGLPIERPNYTGAIEYFLAGIEGSATFDGATDKLSFTHLGLGDASSTLKLDGTALAQIDVNPNNGRHFDLSVEDQPDGTVVGFSPTLDVSAMLNFAPLAAQIPDIAPDVLSNTIHLWFDGTNPSVQDHGDQLKVLSGTLNYTSSYDPSLNFSASAGQCIGGSVDASTTDGVEGAVMTTCE
jgi:hypothetical protein